MAYQAWKGRRPISVALTKLAALAMSQRQYREAPLHLSYVLSTSGQDITNLSMTSAGIGANDVIFRVTEQN